MALPCGTTGSLCSTFVPDRLVGLTVKHPYAIALCRRLPNVLRIPLEASVTLLEATTPVKLPTIHCARGLSVPLRVIGIFTDTTISPSSWLRQCPDRYTIRAGLIRQLSFLQSHVFLVNSRLGLFTAAYRTQRADLPTHLIAYGIQRTIPSVRGIVISSSPHRIYWRAGFSPALSLLMPTFAFLNAPGDITISILRGLECSPTNCNKLQVHSFGSMFMPDYHPCRIARLAHYAKGTLSRHEAAPTACKRMVSGTFSLFYSKYFSPFPHGTSSLSVSQEYLALPDGPG
uniref:Uncharacterized protein n=1 Tax=Setaria digitata TaxID=48799 RepID=A0A915PK08_9BILA